MGGSTAGSGDVTSIDMTDSQRALELRKFFAPFCLGPSGLNEGFNATVNSDGALDAFAETVVWRLRGVRAMVSLIDRTTQYFLAGATRLCEGNVDDISLDREWFGYSTAPTPGGLCENTLAVDSAANDYPCFVVEDLRADDRFASLPVVDGSIIAYRFYAGTPITTDHGINIGSFFMFDDKPRPEGLTLQQRKYLFQSASNVMRHLEIKREAAERRRVALMGKGISTFLETASRMTDADLEVPETSEASNPDKPGLGSLSPSLARPVGLSPELTNGDHGDWHGSKMGKVPVTNVLDKVKLTLDHAANILRESLELTAGGVVFLDTALGHGGNSATNSYFDINTGVGVEFEETPATESKTLLNSAPNFSDIASTAALVRGGSSPGRVRAFNDQYQPAKVLAVSASKTAQWQPSAKAIDGKTLQTLISLYPKGNVWYIDDEGYFSSLEQVDDLCEARSASPSEGRRSAARFDVTRQRAEANLLSKVFEKARQIIFLPLWDAGGNRWYSGCFVWSQSAVPVFTVDSEVSYLSAFTNSLMAEISRLGAITANKMKSDFISSISHEFRSPLHGILASTEFLRDSELDSMQEEFISTIQNCGSTLLDTINHVLDYSKINSFEKKGCEIGSLSNELYQTRNVSLLCEEIVYCMMAAKEFQGMADSSSPRRSADSKSIKLHNHQVLIILDFEYRDWNYRIQTGALRRIIMNIFGNAQKYTEKGFILVQLRVRAAEARDPAIIDGSCQEVLALNIIDSGCGMSTEYMERKLYTPFAQEDSFAPGVGLGLSIVWSIVNQLGGMIHIRSEQGKGTDVEVVVPLESREPSPPSPSLRAGSDIEMVRSSEAQQSLEALRKIAPGKTIAIVRNGIGQPCAQANIALGWYCIENYFSSWFGFTIINPKDHDAFANADIIVIEKVARDFNFELSPVMAATRVLLIGEGMTCCEDRKSKQRNRSFEIIWNPVGPYKLARAVLALFHDKPGREAAVQITTPPNMLSETNQPLLASPASSISSACTPKMEQITSDISNPRIVCETLEAVDSGLRSGRANQPEAPSIHNNTTMTMAGDADPGLAQASLDMQSLSVKPYSQLPIPDTISFSNSPSLEDHNDASLHILAVDDNTLNLQLLYRYLLKRPQDIVVTARNGIEAVAAVREAKSPFDIIFMDISMPNMDGFEATRLIRVFERSLRHREVTEIETHALRPGNNPGEVKSRDEGIDGALWIGDKTVSVVARKEEHSYIVALTGLASRRDRDEAEDSGFDDFLTKPISFGKIGELLARLSAEKMHARQG